MSHSSLSTPGGAAIVDSYRLSARKTRGVWRQTPGPNERGLVASALLDGREVTAVAAREHMAVLLAKLPPKQADLLRLRFGLGNHLPMSQAEAAAHLGISQQHGSRLESKALAALRSK